MDARTNRQRIQRDHARDALARDLYITQYLQRAGVTLKRDARGVFQLSHYVASDGASVGMLALRAALVDAIADMRARQNERDLATPYDAPARYTGPYAALAGAVFTAWRATSDDYAPALYAVRTLAQAALQYATLAQLGEYIAARVKAPVDTPRPDEAHITRIASAFSTLASAVYAGGDDSVTRDVAARAMVSIVASQDSDAGNKRAHAALLSDAMQAAQATQEARYADMLTRTSVNRQLRDMAASDTTTDEYRRRNYSRAARREARRVAYEMRKLGNASAR